MNADLDSYKGKMAERDMFTVKTLGSTGFCK